MTTLETLAEKLHEQPLPAGWRTVRLRDLVQEAQAGFACGRRDPQGVVQLRMNNVDTRGNFVWNDVLRVPADAAPVVQYRLVPGDVLFNNTNSTELVGKSALFEGYDEPVVYSNHFTRLRTKPEVLLPSILAAWLNHQWQRGVFASLCNRWVGQSAVKADKLLKLDFPLPPLPQQQRIAAALREQMAAVEKARIASHAADEAAGSAYEAFVRSLFETAEAETWPRLPLLSLCDGSGQYGTSQKSNGEGIGVPVLGMYHIHEGKIRWEKVSSVDLEDVVKAKYLLRQGDLLFNRTNSAELVGKTAVYDVDKEAVFASYLIRFRLMSAAADPHFVSAYINSRRGRQFIERHMGRAIGQVNISASTMHRMPVPAPDMSIQSSLGQAICRRYDELARLKSALGQQAQAVRALPAALLRMAFAGAI
ncbi:MAG: restriction endonuclease subunit S [Planctomycetes bacterium]|nr:restriction endonuclease subunit S [Planctomycetota bacterium]